MQCSFLEASDLCDWLADCPVVCLLQAGVSSFLSLHTEAKMKSEAVNTINRKVQVYTIELNKLRLKALYMKYFESKYFELFVYLQKYF